MRRSDVERGETTEIAETEGGDWMNKRPQKL